MGNFKRLSKEEVYCKGCGRPATHEVNDEAGKSLFCEACFGFVIRNTPEYKAQRDKEELAGTLPKPQAEILKDLRSKVGIDAEKAKLAETKSLEAAIKADEAKKPEASITSKFLRPGVK